MIYQYNTATIYYKIQGQGTPLVLLHGFLESSTMWDAFLTSLSSKYQILVIDLPGHGRSGNLVETHTMEAMAEVVFNLTQYLGISSFKLIGHSMGGYVGLAMIEQQPQRISAFTLLNSTTYRDSNDRKENRDRAIQFFNTQNKTIISMAIANLFTTEEHKTFKAEIEQLKKEAYSFNADGLISCIKGMRDRKDRTEILQNFEQPTTIIAGIKDPIALIKDVREQAKKANKKLIEIESGHMSWLTHPEKILRFIE